MPTLSSNIVKLEVATVSDVEEALARQALHGGDLATNLLEFADVSEERLTAVIAESIGLEPAPNGELPSAPERVRRLVPGEVAHRYSLYPMEEAEGRLLVAVSEPLPPEVVSDLEFSLGLPLVQRATTLVRVRQAIARDYDLELDRRIARVLARLAGQPDPHPSVPVAASTPAHEAETPRPPPARVSPSHPALSTRERTEPAQGARASVPAESSASATNSPAVEAVASAQAQAPETSVPPAVPRAPAMPNLDFLSFARAERRPRGLPRRLGPYTLGMAEGDLLEAETRDEVIAAFFAFSAQYFEYSALFAVHGDLAEGRDAHGAGASRAKVQAIGVPLELPSTLAQVAAGEPYRLARLSPSGLDGALVKDLQRRPGPTVLLLPIRVRDRTVLVLYGDHGDADVALSAIGDVLSFAPLAAAALERVIRRRKEKARGGPPRNQVPLRPERERPKRNDRGERASALASLVESSSRSRPPPAETPPGPPSLSPTALSAPPFARPVISIGPTRGSASMPATAQSLPVPAPSISVSPGPNSLRPLPSARPTPIPSSFAPGAPPHMPHIPRQERKAILAEVQAEAGLIEREGSDGPPSSQAPSTTPGLGSAPPPRVGKRRQETPIHMPAPPGEGGVAPPKEEPAAAAYVPPSEMPSELEQTPLVDLRTLASRASRVNESPEVSIAAATLDEDDTWTDEELSQVGEPLAPRSRSIAHSARPLAAAGSSKELRLPAVIVDLAQDTEALVARLTAFDQAAAERLVQIGAAAVPALVGAFPGPLTAELRRGVGEGPARASDCGPLMKVLARIGPKAAGVLSVRSNDKDPTIRAWATRLLGEMPCLDAARAVARRFVDEDAEVRRAALAAGRMLEAHPSSGAVLAGALSEMLLDSNRRDRMQHMVIEAIADLREARAVPTLATLLAAGSAEIQRSAHWALVVLARTDYGDNAAAWDEWWGV
jgi:hypothetical protein